MEIPNILLVDKPQGITSFDIIRQLRKKLGIKKMGHGGTLDPMATGLMIIGINEGTKELASLIKLDKVYYADIRLGMSTDSGDADGNVLKRKVVTDVLSDTDIEDVLHTCSGTHTYIVPIYSAIKVDGKPLYWYARNNITPPHIPEKEMTVYAISLLDSYPSDKYWHIRIRIHVSSGTYIRTLAETIGERLGYPAMLTGLRRTRIGDMDITDARTLEEI